MVSPDRVVGEGDQAVRVAIGPREQIVADFKAAIEQLADNPAKLAPMSHAAMARVEQLFTWQAKAKQVAAVYAHAMGETAERPDFGMPLPDVDAGPSSSSEADHASPELAMSPGGDA